MKKRIISILLILMTVLTVCAVGVTGASAADDTATITVGGKSYTVKVGEYVQYSVAFRCTGKNIATAQIELPVDFDGLSGYSEDDLALHASKIAPSTAAASVVLLSGSGNTLNMNGYVMNFVSATGYSFTTQKTVLSLLFGVKKAGNYQLAAKVRYVDDVNDKTLVDSSYVIRDSAFTYTETLEEAELETPQLKVSTAAGGMQIKWNPVPGASKYRVYYKGSGGWTRFAETAETSVLDTDVKNGTRYTYTVRCVNADGTRFTSDYDRDGESAVYYEAPKLTLSNEVDSVKITWNAVSGASKYRVYYKSASGWTRMTETASTSYTDTGIKSGETRIYTIRTLNSSGSFLSWYYTDGFSIKFIRAPEVKLGNAANGVKISWDAVEGAEKYRVFYYGSRGWTRMLDTAETSYLDTAVSSNTNYTYTVRCINADGTAYTSAHRGGRKIKYYEAPKLTLTNAADGVTIKWNTVSGASKYRLYYKGTNGWTKLTDTASTSYTDTSVGSGTTRIYTARAMDNSGNHLSWYYTDGFSIKFVRAPEIKLTNAANGVNISWNAVEGAEKYRVYYYGSKGWTRMVDTTETSYLDTDVSSNLNYTYTVRCINSDGTAFTSYFRAGKKIKFYAAPKLTLSSTSTGVSIKWNAIAGASKYRLYYKTASGWTKLTDTASTSYTDTSIANGAARTYTIRAMDNSNNHLSWYYADGFTITYRK